MGVVRIDDYLEKEIEKIIKTDENRFRYPSKTTFLNIIINDYLTKKSRSQNKCRTKN